MIVGDRHYRSIWSERAGLVHIIDQTCLPHEFSIVDLHTADDAARAIADMQVRGAPLIGATAAYGLALAMHQDPCDSHLADAAAKLVATRPTAINLRWAVESIQAQLQAVPAAQRAALAGSRAESLCEQDVQQCEQIGEHGLGLIRDIAQRKPGPVQLMTHCNAGWLATVDWGTALAPMYKAAEAGIEVHVWVSETRPRNQGMYLTAWELAQHGVQHTVVADNTCGHLMQQGLVDLCIVGTDRTLLDGTVCNKIGTYLKALAAQDNDVPFYVAAPSSSIEWNCVTRAADIPIEQRSAAEVHSIAGRLAAGSVGSITLCGGDNPRSATQFRNDAFDVTPAHLVTGLITERGVSEANAQGLLSLFPEFTNFDDQAVR